MAIYVAPEYLTRLASPYKLKLNIVVPLFIIYYFMTFGSIPIKARRFLRPQPLSSALILASPLPHHTTHLRTKKNLHILDTIIPHPIIEWKKQGLAATRTRGLSQVNSGFTLSENHTTRPQDLIQPFSDLMERNHRVCAYEGLALASKP